MSRKAAAPSFAGIHRIALRGSPPFLRSGWQGL